jgi:NAD(P)H-dependent flavin oxidoreductase YrpB (nitropropane dioxygenase family)
MSGAMPATRFTTLVGASVPIQLAAMPAVATTELVAAVASAGGVGMLPTALLTPALLEQTLDALQAKTTGVVGVNFLVPFLDPEVLAVAARRAPYVEFFYGEPDSQLVHDARAHGARVGWQIGSLAEAIAAERAGCDVIVAQGTEAGGHVRGETSLLPLLSRVLDVVGVPVVAAGGIATARDVAAVLAAGAAAVRVGTRFVAASESGAHPAYVAALLAARAQDTCLTSVFSVMWPDAPHRVLRSAVEAAQASGDEVVGETSMGGARVPVPRCSVFCPDLGTTGRVEAMALYAGESVGNVHRVEPAAHIVADLTSRIGRS